MSSLTLDVKKCFSLIAIALILAGCKSDSAEEKNEELELKKSIPFAYVQRNVSTQAETNQKQFEQSLHDTQSSPLDLFSPYDYQPGAKLLVRAGLEAEALESEVLTSYFGFSNYDVKDLSVSPDGSTLLFAARGPENHAVHSTWSIYLYSFQDKSVRRIIENNDIANAGQDTNPSFTEEGNIIFSSDRDAGDPANPRENIDLVGDLCEKVDPIENPSLLHLMTVDGENIIQLTYGRTNHDLNPTLLSDGRVAFIRWQRSIQAAPQCVDLLGDYQSQKATGLSLPEQWPEASQCSLAKMTDEGPVFITQHYQLLTIEPQSKAMEQLYQTATLDDSDAAFLTLDHLLQAENGHLQALVKHQYNPVLGGAVLDFEPQQGNTSGVAFGEFSPQSLTIPEVDLYPEQYSTSGWFSSFWPYQDGSQRFLVSWTQCSILEQGINRFCKSSDTQGALDVQYGIWVYDPDTDTRLPVVRNRNDVVYTELAISQPKKTANLSLTSFNSNFVDNPDATRIVCHFPNNPPIANAGNDQTGLAGNTYALNGSASYDPDGDTLSYLWSILEKPQGSTALLSDINAVNPELKTDMAGQYRMQLIVNDGKDASAPDSVTVTVVVDNNTPVANAGVDQAVTIGSNVQLDGSGSNDPDGDSLEYRWMILNAPTQSSVSLSGADTVAPSFVPDQVGNYRIQLIVNDGKTDSAPDTVNVSVDTPPNQAPIANAGSDQSGALGSSFTLDGSASRDPDGDTISYRWSIQSKPAGSNVSLFNGNTVAPGLTPDVEGNYVIQLIVNDGMLDSNSDLVTVSVVKNNTLPMANAGVDQNGFVGDSIIFNGSASSDPDGDSLTYRWNLISRPEGSSATLVNANSVNSSLTADKEGDFIVRLIVNDGEFDSNADTATLSVVRRNQKPIADAGIDQILEMGHIVSLDGSRSSDADGDPLTYSWVLTTIPNGSATILTNSDNVSPSLQPDVEGEYHAQLVVNDGREDSDADSVVITITQANLPPVADAGADRTVTIGDSVSLNGAASYDPEGEPLTYQWLLLQKPDGSNSVLSQESTVSPQLTTDIAGEYLVQLIVNDGIQDSPADTVTVVAEHSNRRPVANAGADQPYRADQSLQLDGSASTDADGDALTYQWSVESPATDNIELTNAESVTPSVVIHDNQTYRLKLIVNDGQLDSEPDYVELSPANTKPVANAGPDQSVLAGNTALLDGSASSDMDGDTLTYEWRIVSRPDSSNSELTSANGVSPSLTPDTSGLYVIELKVFDGSLWSEPDSVTVSVDENLAPIANAGTDRVAYLDSQVILDGSASRDPDGDALTYRWSLIRKPDYSQTQLIGANQVNPQLEIDVVGEFVVQLIVNDGQLDSQPDTVMISTQNMRPVAEAGNTQSVTVNDTVTLDGSASYDPDGDALSYRWSLLTNTEGQPPAIINPNSEKPQFTPTEPGTYVFQLIVNDGALDSSPDTVSIEVTDIPPACDLSDDTQRVLPVTIRDFTVDHPDFEYEIGVDYGIVSYQLGSDGLPVYAHPNGHTDTTTGQDNFDQWYRDVAGVNLRLEKTLLITRQSDTTIWEYRNEDFFPIDGEGFGNSGLTNPDHNFHFTLETHLAFDYKGGEVFTFRGDDDLWLFINGKLAIDIGGVHSVIERTIKLDDLAEGLGLIRGNRYRFDLFFAERHTTRSNFMFQTNMELECSE